MSVFTMYFPPWSISLVVLVLAIIMLDLFAKHVLITLAEMTFIQFNPTAELGSVFLGQVFILQKTNSSYRSLHL